MNNPRRKELGRIDDALARISCKLGDMCLLEHQVSEKGTREERSEHRKALNICLCVDLEEGDYAWRTKHVIVGSPDFKEPTNAEGDVVSGFGIYCSMDDESILKAKKKILKAMEMQAAALGRILADLRQELGTEEILA